MIKPGKVYLIGADACACDVELFSLTATVAIATADVILIDNLVNPAILVHAASHARIVRVGKRGSSPSAPREFIERLMIAEAHIGHCVVRLNGGGESFLPGRGDDERKHLQTAGIEVDVINGLNGNCRITTPGRSPASPS